MTNCRPNKNPLDDHIQREKRKKHPCRNNFFKKNRIKEENGKGKNEKKEKDKTNPPWKKKQR